MATQFLHAKKIPISTDILCVKISSVTCEAKWEVHTFSSAFEKENYLKHIYSLP